MPLSPSSVLLVVGVAGLVVARRRALGRPTSVVVVVAVGGLAFQAVHTVEHLVQLGHWVWRPEEGAWLTPWAATARDVLAGDPDARVLGTELLHLVGNLVFLSGAMAVAASVRRVGTDLRRGVVVQLAHATEHVLLTLTFGVTGTAVGISSGFGLLPGGPVSVAVRVWGHAAVNAVATWLVLRGWWRSRERSDRGRR